MVDGVGHSSPGKCSHAYNCMQLQCVIAEKAGGREVKAYLPQIRCVQFLQSYVWQSHPANSKHNIDSGGVTNDRDDIAAVCLSGYHLGPQA